MKPDTQYGALTVVARDGSNRHGRSMWRCRCLCGAQKRVSSNHLQSGAVKSCGCQTNQMRSKASTTHGMAGTPEYYSWYQMIQRCQNPDHKSYADYGGRGITVCERWQTFELFYKDMGSRPAGKTLDRKENSGDYCLSNCQWATPLEQGQNKRNNRLVTRDGVTKTVAQWCRDLKLNHKTVKSRVQRGDPEDTWFRPIATKRTRG